MNIEDIIKIKSMLIDILKKNLNDFCQNYVFLDIVSYEKFIEEIKTIVNKLISIDIYLKKQGINHHLIINYFTDFKVNKIYCEKNTNFFFGNNKFFSIGDKIIFNNEPNNEYYITDVNENKIYLNKNKFKTSKNKIVYVYRTIYNLLNNFPFTNSSDIDMLFSNKLIDILKKYCNDFIQ
jgi:hypothetical protein